MENFEGTSYDGWCPSELLPWIQKQDPKIFVAIGIAMFLIAGKLARIPINFFIILSFYPCFQELLFFRAWENWRSINLSKTPWEQF
jgi:hypothetical protein